MANKEIENLNSADLPLTGAELIHVVQDGNSRKVTADDIIIRSDLYHLVPLGEMVRDIGLAGWVAPDKDSSLYRYVLLTAGETGTGEYNEGVLTSESVTGSAPLVLATAVIDFATSPFHGETISLINTEGRFLRASITAGALQNDAFQAHHHNLFVASGQRGTATAAGSTDVVTSSPAVTLSDRVIGAISDGSNGTPRTANETRPKSIGAVCYLRIA